MRPQTYSTPSPSTDLTPRELQVLELIADGLTSKQIANQLGMSFKTACSHRNNIMNKLEAHKITQLVRYAIRRGLIAA
jgi:two-component system response regulator NreC